GPLPAVRAGHGRPAGAPVLGPALRRRPAGLQPRRGLFRGEAAADNRGRGAHPAPLGRAGGQPPERRPGQQLGGISRRQPPGHAHTHLLRGLQRTGGRGSGAGVRPIGRPAPPPPPPAPPPPTPTPTPPPSPA